MRLSGAKHMRIVIALSGGIDSAVTALFLTRCVHTKADLRALWSTSLLGGSSNGTREALWVPALTTVRDAIERRRPWADVMATHVLCSTFSSMSGGDETIHYTPLYMQNWEDSDSAHGWCATSLADYQDAQSVAHGLDLLASTRALMVVNLSAEYVDRCFNPMLAAYAQGSTLNVDVLCNSEIKLGALLDRVQAPPTEADVVATGHYARTVRVYSTDDRGGQDDLTEAPRVLLGRPLSAARDHNDQSVFLSRVSSAALAKAVFPLGHIFSSKADVRALAGAVAGTHAWLAPLTRKCTSTGICFVGRPRSTSATSASHARRSPKPRAPISTCQAPFSSFLDEYLPPPSQLANCVNEDTKTRFVEAVSGEVLDASCFPALCSSGGGMLPAYAVTVGQKLMYARKLDECRRDGSKRASTHMQRYYVASKQVTGADQSTGKVKHDAAGDSELEGTTVGQATALLREVRVVPFWNHPLLWQSIVRARDMYITDTRLLRSRMVVPPGNGVSSSLGNDLESEGATWEEARCLCCVRHQHTPQWGIFRWQRGAWQDGEQLLAGKVEMILDEPTRAVTPGQALVLYTPLYDVTEANVVPHDLCVLGSGWIVDG